MSLQEETISNQTNYVCTFLFEDGKEIEADTLPLASCSPVFQRMFYGKLVSKQIVITDITCKHFRETLQFIGGGKVKLNSVLHAWSLFYVAHKYELDNLGDICVNYIQKNFNINNIILNYEYAEMYGLEVLQKNCMFDINLCIRGIFSKFCDYHMKPTSLLMILKQRTLHIRNDELITDILNWAVIECDIKSISVSPKNVISHLKSLGILSYLVDLNFTVHSFKDNFIKTCSQLIHSFKNSKTDNRKYFQQDWLYFCKCRRVYKIASRIEMGRYDAFTSNISCDRDSLLYGLLIGTETPQSNEKEKKYDGAISIQISDQLENVYNTEFYHNFQYDGYVYVPLSEVIFLEAKQLYSVKIKYKRHFYYCGSLRIKTSSILFYYMNHKLATNDVDFYFDELDGSVIKGISYYPV